MIQNSKFKIQNSLRGGAMTLITILIVSAIIMIISVATLAVSDLFTSTVISGKSASQAMALAEAGARDGMLKVQRNCPFGAVGTGVIGCPSSYAVTVGSNTANVLILDEIPATPNGNKIIISTGVILGSTKRVQAILSIDQTTGKVSTKSFGECYNYKSTTRACL